MVITPPAEGEKILRAPRAPLLVARRPPATKLSKGSTTLPAYHNRVFLMQAGAAPLAQPPGNRPPDRKFSALGRGLLRLVKCRWGCSATMLLEVLARGFNVTTLSHHRVLPAIGARWKLKRKRGHLNENRRWSPRSPAEDVRTLGELVPERENRNHPQNRDHGRLNLPRILLRMGRPRPSLWWPEAPGSRWSRAEIQDRFGLRAGMFRNTREVHGLHSARRSVRTGGVRDAQ